MGIKRREVRWADTAEDDLLGIVEYIARQRPLVAERILEGILSRAQSLSVVPDRGRIVSELQKTGYSEYREIVIVPWRLVYRVADDAVHVIALIDARRKVEDVLRDRLPPLT